MARNRAWKDCGPQFGNMTKLETRRHKCGLILLLLHLGLLWIASEGAQSAHPVHGKGPKAKHSSPASSPEVRRNHAHAPAARRKIVRHPLATVRRRVALVTKQGADGGDTIHPTSIPAPYIGGESLFTTRMIRTSSVGTSTAPTPSSMSSSGASTSTATSASTSTSTSSSTTPASSTSTSSSTTSPTPSTSTSTTTSTPSTSTSTTTTTPTTSTSSSTTTSTPSTSTSAPTTTPTTSTSSSTTTSTPSTSTSTTTTTPTTSSSTSTTTSTPSTSTSSTSTTSTTSSATTSTSTTISTSISACLCNVGTYMQCEYTPCVNCCPTGLFCAFTPECGTYPTCCN